MNAAYQVADAGGDELERFIKDLQQQLKEVKDGRVTRPDDRSSRATIASLAIEILMGLRGKPPRSLAYLLHELLELTGPRVKYAKRPEERRAAAILLGEAAANQVPRGIRELAGDLRVDPSTVSRWLKDPKFQQEVEDWREKALKDLA